MVYETMRTGFEGGPDYPIGKRMFIARIKFLEGLCRADPGKPYAPRDIRNYQERVIIPGMKSGKINDGSDGGYDDRKMRFSHSFIEHATDSAVGPVDLNLCFGHTCFEEFKEVFNNDLFENHRLVDKGVKIWGDRYAFFARAPGVQGVPITKDGEIILGIRNVNTTGNEGEDLYTGALNGTGGSLIYRENPKDIDLEEDVVREASELGVLPNHIEKIVFCGAFSNPELFNVDFDFGHLVFTNQPAEYWSSGKYLANVPESERGEHKEKLVVIRGKRELDQLLKEGQLSDGRKFDIIYSACGVLDSIEPDEMA